MENIDPFLCTHIIILDGKIYNNTIVPSTSNSLSDIWHRGVYEKVTDLKHKNQNLKVLLSISGKCLF